MPVVAIVNRKGGSGKSTLATNVAAWCAQGGLQVMLGDVDRQRSVNGWLSRRSADAPVITSWAVDRSKVLRPPAGTTHVVLDTPGALYDHELARLAMNVSAMVVPIGPSVFDSDASLQFLDELRQLPRVRSGRCRVIAVGMRWPEDKRQAWISNNKQWDTPLLTVIPEASIYRTCLETGASIFDSPQVCTPQLLEPWNPLLRWLQLAWSANAPAATGPETQASERQDGLLQRHSEPTALPPRASSPLRPPAMQRVNAAGSAPQAKPVLVSSHAIEDTRPRGRLGRLMGWLRT